MAAAAELRVRAPGRVNLIGEHTDYNDGFVLPAAIDLELRIAFRPRADGAVVLHSQELDSTIAVHPGGAPGDSSIEAQHDAASWAPYVRGVHELLGLPIGIEGEIASEVPLGSGLSSSAALELGVARALAAANEREWQPVEMAGLCQRAEIEYAGNRCGIMDQLAVAAGLGGHALLIDCRTLAIEPAPLPPDLAIVMCDTAKPRQLVASAYNDRRAACEEASRRLGVPSLRDVLPAMLSRLPEPLASRARHVVAENQRVLDFAAALRAGDRAALGRLMAESHASLRDLYEVSCPELDLLVELAERAPGCVGSRLTGAGFGGCTVSLVVREAAPAFAERVIAEYRRRSGLPGRSWTCQAVDGASLVG
jgi:galactokinase